MKIIRRYIPLIFAISILFSIVGCDNKETTNKNIPVLDEPTLLDRKYEYAKLAINKGLGVTKGMVVYIDADTECYEFARICAEEAYKAGAKNVVVNWTDESMIHLKYAYADDSVFEKYHKYKDEFYKELYEEKAANLYLLNTFPGLFNDLNDEQLYRPSPSEYSEYIDLYDDAINNNELTWCIIGVPNKLWATTLFPDVDPDEAIEKLWDAILNTVMVNGTGDSIETWNKHIEELNNEANKLNDKKFKTLHYTNSLGTDFTIDLPENGLWTAADSSTPEGISFVANMPTEEVYTAPLVNSCNGTICSSLPLELNGTIVNDIKFTVENGKIINAEASSGLNILNTYLNTDEGARYFGEVSLVPYDSPISNSGILFYNTLYDENASCHMAFGNAYPESIEGGVEMSEEELVQAGLNRSDTHIDFMIGTADLKIVGTTYSGEEIIIFENGNFSSIFSQ